MKIYKRILSVILVCCMLFNNFTIYGEEPSYQVFKEGYFELKIEDSTNSFFGQNLRANFVARMAGSIDSYMNLLGISTPINEVTITTDPNQVDVVNINGSTITYNKSWFDASITNELNNRWVSRHAYDVMNTFINSNTSYGLLNMPSAFGYVHEFHSTLTNPLWLSIKVGSTVYLGEDYIIRS